MKRFVNIEKMMGDLRLVVEKERRNWDSAEILKKW
jgi:hypothetical protein